MTDLLSETSSVPARLGVLAEFRDDEFRLRLDPRPELLHHGALRASVIAFMIDVVAGIVLDDDPDAWMLTSDMSVRMQPVAAPASSPTRLDASSEGAADRPRPRWISSPARGATGGDGRDRVRPGAAPSGGCRQARSLPPHAHHDHVRRFQNPDTPPPGGSGHRGAGTPGAGALRDAPVTPGLRNPVGTPPPGRHGWPWQEAAAGGLGVDQILPPGRGDRARSSVSGAVRGRPRPVEMSAARCRSGRPD